MSLTGRSVSAWYKDLLEIDNSNSGVDGTLRPIKSGEGTNSAVYVSTGKVKILPAADSTTTLDVQDKDGNNKLLVDTTNDYVKALGHHANTQYINFGISNVDSSGFSADTHYAIPFRNMTSAASNLAMGTSTNPDTSLTISSTGHTLVNMFWYVLDDITIDRAVWWHGADAATGDTTRAHIMQYDIVSDNSSTSGDLSSGVVLCDGADITNAGYEQSYMQQMTIQTANVDAGKAVFFVFRSDSVNSDFSINAQIKVHMR